jgi:DNA (cytosine-5)-methyltransferase 1
VKYLSVCSGIEAASVAWHPLGWEPLAFSEIEPFPRAVLAHHYPDVPVHGDFTKLRDHLWIDGADILVGGTPCQAFSVAGLRNSLADDRGNLSLEFVRLADAIDAVRRDAGKPPAVIVWENVPGVLSVKDNAFGCFLAGLAGDVDPYVPPRGKWTNAGVVDGPARQVAWRVLDAQYFGLAQRRRRVFVVASARDGFDPAAVLLEWEGLRRDSPPRREAGKGTAHDLAPSLTNSGRGVERTGDTRGKDPVVAVNWLAASTGEVSHCLNAGGMGRQDFETETLVTHALRARTPGQSEGSTTTVIAQPIPFDTTQITSPANYSKPEAGDPCHPLAAGAHPPAIAFSAKDHGADAAKDLSPTLRALGAYDANGGGAGIGVGAVATGMVVRRLTPTECERLQGFPDGYTNIPWRGKPEAPDGPRYKALGNSMAVPVMRWIGRRIAEALK